VKVAPDDRTVRGLSEYFELSHGFAAARHGPKVALVDDPLHMALPATHEPRSRGSARAGAAASPDQPRDRAGFDDGRRMLRQYRLKALALESAITGLSVQL